MNNELGLPTEHVAEGLQKAREYRGISQKDTAELLGISSNVLRNYENGKCLPSLPELESLSYIYHIPLNVLVSPTSIEEYTNQPNAEQLQNLIKVRQKIISTSLQIAFDESGLTQKDLAKNSDVSRSKIRRYLDGNDIPLDDLKRIASVLGMDLTLLIDKESQIGEWQANQVACEMFANLPENIQEFLRNRENWDFINSAYSLNSLDQKEIEMLSTTFSQLRDILQTKS